MGIDERTSQYRIFNIRTVPRAARFRRIRMMYWLYLVRPLYGKNIICADDSGIFILVMYRKTALMMFRYSPYEIFGQSYILLNIWKN